jgi:hypothetical protein
MQRSHVKTACILVHIAPFQCCAWSYDAYINDQDTASKMPFNIFTALIYKDFMLFLQIIYKQMSTL